MRPLEKSSAAEACNDARGLLKDGVRCDLASLLASWSSGEFAGHEERNFQRLTNFVNPIHKPTYTQIRLFLFQHMEIQVVPETYANAFGEHLPTSASGT